MSCTQDTIINHKHTYSPPAFGIMHFAYFILHRSLWLGSLQFRSPLPPVSGLVSGYALASLEGPTHYYAMHPARMIYLTRRNRI